jgi:parvulin-like peptidyl-prolyl isomerase
MQLTQPISLGRDVLDEMIDTLMIREEAAKRGITVSEEEIDRAVEAAFGFFPDGTPTPTVTSTILPSPTYSETQQALINTPTPLVEEGEELDAEQTPTEEDSLSDAEDTAEAFEQEIEEAISEEIDTTEPGADFTATPEVTPTITLTPTPYTTEMFDRNIRDFNDMYAMYNIDIDDLRGIFEDQLYREKLVEEITQDLPTIREEVRARHILVESYEEALNVKSLLDEGEDFYTLAGTYSIDASNREQGGDLGWFDENTMVPEFTEAAFSMDEGEISDPVETTFGFHIIQVTGKREHQIPPAEFSQVKQRAFNEWLAEHRETRTDITIFEGWDAYVPTIPEVPQQFIAELFQQPQQ